MSSRKLCFGNWKLHKNKEETISFLKDFESLVEKEDLKNFCIFPPALVASEFSEAALPWGGQNIYSEVQGAFTGENSAQTLKDMSAAYVLVGHSERRKIFLETNEVLNQKLKTAQKSGLKVVYCVGEDLEEREKGQVFEVLKKQLDEGLQDVSQEHLIVAYEPVWAIGTGKTASLKEVSEVHLWLKDYFKDAQVSFLYGGSVKPANAKELYSDEHVHGFLVGGASLEASSFVQIYKEMGGS